MKPSNKLPKSINLNEDAVIDLAAHILGMSPDEEVVGEIEEKLVERWSLDLREFAEIVGLLLPMAGQFNSALSGKFYRAFAVVEKDGRALALAKTEVDAKNQQNYK
ncbi:MAG TPA: hypothetical protein PLB89_05130 [Flavobacteriales bacterium]|nr:hypothetical protein [Flavobacteriales bacterium]